MSGEAGQVPEHAMVMVDWSPEEKLAMRQCSREVSLYRALPAGALFGPLVPFPCPQEEAGLGTGGGTWYYLSRFRGGTASVGVKAFLCGLVGYGVARASGVQDCFKRLR